MMHCFKLDADLEALLDRAERAFADAKATRRETREKLAISKAIMIRLRGGYGPWYRSPAPPRSSLP